MIRDKKEITNESIDEMGEDIMENVTNIEDEIEEVNIISNENTIKDEITIENEKSDFSAKNKTKVKEIKKLQTQYKPTNRSQKGVLTLVKSRNGKRAMISKEVQDLLGNVSKIEIGMTDEGIVIAEKLLENGTKFTLKKVGNKGVIYSASFVEELTKAFDLDFSNRVSITFSEAEETEIGDTIAVEIKMK